VVAVVDIYGAQPDWQGEEDGASAATPAAARKQCSLHYVHHSLYSNRPLYRILQVRCACVHSNAALPRMALLRSSIAPAAVA
jgi:hypothetical protein